MSYRLIQDRDALAEASRELGSVTRLALDCEAAGFHRFNDRLCLVQLSTRRETLLLDPFSVELAGFLRPLLEDPEIQVVMHGADFDIRLLDRDLGLRLRGLFDTQAAAALLGESALGLASLLEKHLGVELEKKHQRADWAQRPLPENLLEYAAEDTRHLLELGSLLEARLREQDRYDWAREEFHVLEAIRWEEDETDPVTRVKAARDLSPRDVTALRTAMEWRDEIARERDRAPFRVVGDKVLLDVVLRRPSTTEELAETKGVSPRLARERGRELLDRLESVSSLPASDLEPYPHPSPGGPGRPTPEEEELAGKIRNLRTDRSRDLGLDRGVVLSNAQIMEIVRADPDTQGELEALPGIKAWQAGLLGTEILKILDGSEGEGTGERPRE
jgi:ribonuclease D